MNAARSHEGFFMKAMERGLTLLLMVILPGCTARHLPDWSQVQAVSPQTKIEVQLYEDETPQGSRKVKGRFQSATADALTLMLKDGQARTLQKPTVRKVLTRRPLSERWPGWTALAGTFGVLQTLLSMSASVDNVSGSTMVGVHAVFTLPITAAFFYGSRMEGIYEVPPNHRDWYPQGTSSPATGVEKPENSK